MSAKIDANGLSRKLKSLHQLAIGLESMPRDAAIAAVQELISRELNFNPVGRISGNLARSFGFTQLGAGTWAVQQTQQIAPYAQEVAQRIARKFGANYVELADDRTRDAILAAIDEEFARAIDRINAGRPYVYRPLQPIF